jgi:prevent-host-death family protein
MQTTMDSNDARLHWREVLDSAGKGIDVVITRYRKPVGVFIDYDDYQALLEQLEDLRDGRRALATLEQIRADPARVRSLESIVDDMIAEGSLERDDLSQ